MDAYPGQGQRRILPTEIRDWARSKYRVELVQGFAQLVDKESVIECSGRIAGFLETSNVHGWYLTLSSGGYLKWRTGPVPASPVVDDVVFVFVMGLGNGSALPQPTGQFHLYCNGKFVVAFRVVKHSQTWRTSSASFHFSASRIESAPPNGSVHLDEFLVEESSASFGIGLLRVPAGMIVAGRSADLKVVPVSEVGSSRWFQLTEVTSCIECVDILSGLESLCSRTWGRSSGFNVYFGDIHTHSGEGPEACGVGTRQDNYGYARGAGALDVYALTDHEWQIGPNGARSYLELADSYQEDGQFVCLPSYEHTSTLYGHRNVYFGDSGGTVVPAHRGWKFDYWNPDVAVTPDELWTSLGPSGVPAITVPHHTSSTYHPLSWDFCNPRHDRLVEIYSTWGSSEYYGDYPHGVSSRFRTLSVRDAFARGYLMGIIASSDGHDGHPGNAQSPLVKHHLQFHPLGCGWIAVLAPKLTRADIFEAMHARRCYGTTGVPIVLEFTVENHVMGSELSPSLVSPKPMVCVKCQGCNGIDHVRIVKNGRIALTVQCHGEWQCDVEWRDPCFEARGLNYYYVRVVQVDHESAWSSPVWIA